MTVWLRGWVLKTEAYLGTGSGTVEYCSNQVDLIFMLPKMVMH